MQTFWCMVKFRCSILCNSWICRFITWHPFTQHYFPSFGQVLLLRIATKPTLEWRFPSTPRSKINVLLLWLESMWILKCLHLSCTTISWALQIPGASEHVCFHGKPLNITIYYVCFAESILPEIWKIGGCVPALDYKAQRNYKGSIPI